MGIPLKFADSTYFKLVGKANVFTYFWLLFAKRPVKLHM